MKIRICLCLFFLVVSSIFAFSSDPVTTGDRQREQIKIRSLSITTLNIPPQCTNGFFMADSKLVAFQAPDESMPMVDYPLSKYYICDKKGLIVKEIDKVVWWGGGSIILKLNVLSVMLYIDTEKNIQKTIDLDIDTISSLSVNPYTKRIIYICGYESRINEYDAYTRHSRIIAKLTDGMMGSLTQLSPQEILFVRYKMSASYGKFDRNIWYKVQLPVFVFNSQKQECSELARISPVGMLSHFDQRNNQVTFIVEEKGYLRLISSDIEKNNKKINVQALSSNCAKFYDGILLSHSTINRAGTLIASSRVKLVRKEEVKNTNFESFSLTNDNFDVASGEIYILDFNGNSKPITKTPNIVEVVCDWSPNADEILYRDHISKNFYLMELDLSGVAREEPYRLSTDNITTL